jgi:Ca2+-binding EF-hand superfamily protein
MASTKLDMARIQAAFDQCEQDADKCIDRKAVAKLFKRLGQSVGKKELDRMVCSI